MSRDRRSRDGVDVLDGTIPYPTTRSCVDGIHRLTWRRDCRRGPGDHSWPSPEDLPSPGAGLADDSGCRAVRGRPGPGVVWGGDRPRVAPHLRLQPGGSASVRGLRPDRGHPLPVRRPDAFGGSCGHGRQFSPERFRLRRLVPSEGSPADLVGLAPGLLGPAHLWGWIPGRGPSPDASLSGGPPARRPLRWPRERRLVFDGRRARAVPLEYPDCRGLRSDALGLRRGAGPRRRAHSARDTRDPGGDRRGRSPAGCLRRAFHPNRLRLRLPAGRRAAADSPPRDCGEQRPVRAREAS